MRLNVLVMGVFAVLATTVPAFASAPPPLPIYEPVSGPPGTVVNVSNINFCDTQQPPITTGQIGFAISQAAVHTPPPFTPPNAEITVPDVPNGDYTIFLFCGPAVESLPFTVTGSTVSQPVVGAPTFTG